MPKTGRHKTGPGNLRYNLVSFSTFEELMLPIKGPMEDAGVVKHYEPSRTQCLNVNMVGRIPLMQCFLWKHDSHHPSKNKNSCFPGGCADTAAEDEAL